MVEIILNGNVGVVALTPELASALTALGENVHELNIMRWPAGASNYGCGVFLVHSSALANLNPNNLQSPISVLFSDDTQDGALGYVQFSAMYQVEQRPIHIFAGSAKGDVQLVAIKLVDARYFWKGILNSSSFNVTTSSDRSEYYTNTESGGTTPYTWTAAINSLLSTMGVSATFTLKETGAGSPTDFLQNGDPVSYTLDRMLSAFGLIFVANTSPGPPINATGNTTNTMYQIVTSDSMESNALSHGTTFKANRVAGGTSWTSTSPILNAIMPSSVTVRFPREIVGQPDIVSNASSPPLSQFYFLATTYGAPSGISGKQNFTVLVNDSMWALGPIGSETNTGALNDRLHFLSNAYYARWRCSVNNARLMGWCNIGPVAGEVSWWLGVDGPFTEIHTRQDWSLFGGDVDVIDGFNTKQVIGLGGTQVHRTYDGSLIVSSEVPRLKGRITAVTGSFPTWTYTWQLVASYDSSQSGFNKWVVSGSTLTATNRLEYSGTPNYTYGNGLLITSSSGQINSGSCVIISAPVGAVVDIDMDVDIHTNSTIYSFEFENSGQ